MSGNHSNRGGVGIHGEGLVRSPGSYPQRIGEPHCRDFLRTGRCKYGDSCKYHHPPNVQSGGGVMSTNPSEPPFPIRPGEPPCQYFLKHGTCKFGQTCKFDHPPNQKANHLPEQLLPQRPGEPDCIYFLRNGRCKYGITCKYHHPVGNLRTTHIPGEVMSVPQTRYILVEPTNVVMINPNGTLSQQNYFPASPMLVSASGIGSSPMMTSSVASSYDTAVSHLGDYPSMTSWQQTQAHRRSRLNSFSSAISQEEMSQRGGRSESSSSLKPSGSFSSLPGLQAQCTPVYAPRSLKDENYEEGLSQMTSSILNIIDNENSEQQREVREERANAPSTAISPSYDSRQRSLSLSSTRSDEIGNIFSEGAIKSFQESLQPKSLLMSNQEAGGEYVNEDVKNVPRSFNVDPYEMNRNGAEHHSLMDPPKLLPHNSSSNPRGLVVGLDSDPLRVSALSSVMEESQTQHAQNWSQSSWQPSAAVPGSTFFDRV